MDTPNLQSLYKRVQNAGGLTAIITLLSAIKDNVSDVRVPIQGLSSTDDDIKLRRSIIQVVDSLLIMPLSSKMTDGAQQTDADSYR